MNQLQLTFTNKHSLEKMKCILHGYGVIFKSSVRFKNTLILKESLTNLHPQILMDLNECVKNKQLIIN